MGAALRAAVGGVRVSDELRAYAVNLVRATRGAVPSYECTFLALMIAEASFLLLIDALIAHATSAAVEWVALPSVLHVLGILCLHMRGPVRPGGVAVSLLFRLVVAYAIMLQARGGGRVLLRN